MRIRRWLGSLAGVLAGMAMLTGCGGGAPSTFAPATQSGGAARAVHPDRARSWVAPEAKKDDLLYVSDSDTYDVYMYSYPRGKLVGTLTDQNNPGGLCVDKKGDVFVTQLYGGGHIVEYAHGKTTAIESLSDPGYEPGGCSVDPASGDLAVSNIVTTEFDVGNLLIFKGAKGTPSSYAAPAGTNASGAVWGSVNTCGYDDKGNVFFAGHGYPDANVFGELPNGASSTENITLKQSFGSGIGNVQWDGTYITFASIDGSIYRFKMKGTTGKVVGSTVLNGSDQVDQGWIQGKRVIAPQQFAADVFYYAYPAGGNSTKTVGGLSAPFGTTVSLARKT
jgi:hypothetical protein